MCVSTWFLATAQTMNTPAAVGPQTQKRPWRQHGPLMSMRLQVAAQTMGIQRAFSNNMGHGHQHRSWMQQHCGLRHGPLPQQGLDIIMDSDDSVIWPLAVAWPTDINMASGDRTDHRHRYDPHQHDRLRHHCLKRQHRPLT